MRPYSCDRHVIVQEIWVSRESFAPRDDRRNSSFTTITLIDTSGSDVTGGSEAPSE